MEALISVIIPVYNRRNVLEECVKSVREQTWKNLEILLIDDGSTDGSDMLCSLLAEADERIRVLNLPHRGVSAARNAGLDAAAGEYLFFVDSDDVIDPRLLETLCLGIQNHHAGIGASDIFNVSEKRWRLVAETIKSDQHTGALDCFTWEEALNACFSRQTPINQIGGVMMHKALTEGTRFREDLFIGEDFYFIYENVIKGGRVVFLQPKWYYCRLHDRNSSWNYTYEGFWTRFYRRVLVWEQEEKMGRQHNADLQKQEACGLFLYCLKRNSCYSADSIRMRKTLRNYTTQLFPALPLGEKLKCMVALYLPWAYYLLVPFKKILKLQNRSSN